jgi:hypothetical protein
MSKSEMNTSVRKKVTRAATNVWLVGQQLPVIDKASCGSQLPTVGHVLRRLYHDLKTRKLCLSTSCSNVINEVLELWRIANIPTTQKPNAIAKLKGMYEKHTNVSKNK